MILKLLRIKAAVRALWQNERMRKKKKKGLLYHLKIGNGRVISFMCKCPVVLISRLYLPAIKSSFQNTVRTGRVPSAPSILDPL